MVKAASRKTRPSEMVAESVRGRIRRGELRPGDFVQSERSLCRDLGVSRMTVRRGLERLVNCGLLSRRPGRGYLVGPLPQSPSGPRPAGRGSAVVFLHARPESELAIGGDHARMWASAREEFARDGRLTMVSSVEQETLTSELAGELAASAAGVLCDYEDDAGIARLLDAGLAVVHIHYRGSKLPIDCVVQDDSGGIRGAVAHLHARGHRRIGYLDTSERLAAFNHAAHAIQRRAGYVAACDEFGVGVSPDLIAPADYYGADELGSVRKLLKAGATALVVPHRGLLEPVRRALGKAGKLRGRSFGLVAWGEPPAAGEKGFPTSVSWSREQMGAEGARRLRLRLERPGLPPATTLIPTEIVDRGTGGKGPGA